MNLARRSLLSGLLALPALALLTRRARAAARNAADWRRRTVRAPSALDPKRKLTTACLHLSERPGGPVVATAYAFNLREGWYERYVPAEVAPARVQVVLATCRRCGVRQYDLAAERVRGPFVLTDRRTGEVVGSSEGARLPAERVPVEGCRTCRYRDLTGVAPVHSLHLDHEGRAYVFGSFDRRHAITLPR